MPVLALSNFNIVCAILGGFITVFGLVSYLLKEKLYLSEALISLIAGVVFSPHATNWVHPEEYALGSIENLDAITLYFTRLVLGVQLVLAGIQLPSKYLKTEWRSLALLLGPGMTVMWLVTSLLVFAFVPHITFLQALAVGACVTPTDPVLSNSIVKGKFADKNIPKELQKIVVAESGANDGLGYPFLFLPLYLIEHIGHGGLGSDNSVRTAMGLWFGETWGYTILLSVVYGATVGWIAKELLHWAEERQYVDRESFLVHAITLALFIVGTAGMLGSDDVLACFIAGNTFTWDDWFRLETQDDSFQPTIDMLLNVSVFIWFGAVCPWPEFYHNHVISITRLVFLGILVLLLRRLPIVYAMHKYIPQIEQKRQALFVGFFGPIGVSAIFYLYVSLEFLRKITVDGEVREDAQYLMEVMNVVIWFLCICSIVVHGLSIPMAKLGFFIPRTLSNALSTQREDNDQAFYVSESTDGTQMDAEQRIRRRPGWSRSGDTLPQRVVRIGRSIIPSGHNSGSTSRATSQAPVPLSAPPTMGRGETEGRRKVVGSGNVDGDAVQEERDVQRTIRFPDEAQLAASKIQAE
ncbi:Sodium/hydrogen exchanger family-domain-containing protein [Paraphoma chrysanthemicola]|uniref:Sodium/hydrogen exchanger family-domain-containing protein n=1 Tax=Paraphoma chrysanthemicola TaxID=798071 RepID=A0A8K0R9A6_9PLEO|nr:Sodium/hydrogen exchanger family-domain-containing protein [Paraphoma chrysanthemicola]